MSTSHTTTGSDSFTLLHAKQLASRVSADMKRCQHFYGHPSDDQISLYATELAHLLNGGFVAEYEFGYQRNEQRIVSCHYRVKNGDLAAANDRPGGIEGGVDISGASRFNFLTYSSKWSQLPQSERDKFSSGLPIQRPTGNPPTDGAGYWVEDKVYSAAGTVLSRRTFKPYTT